MPHRRPLILITDDHGLRTSLAAQLTIAGETVLVASDPAHAAVARLMGRGATLVIDAPLFTAAKLPETGRVIVLGAALNDLPDDVVPIDRATAADGIRRWLRTWRSRA